MKNHLEKDQIMAQYEGYSDSTKVTILTKALCKMGSNNSLSRWDCIALSMGLKIDIDNGKYYYED